MKIKLIIISIVCIGIFLVAYNNQSKNNNDQTTNNKDTITLEKAKEIAINNAGIPTDKVSMLKEEYTTEDGVNKYDIEFFTNDNKEYDYEINANTGEIISYDNELEDFINEDMEEVIKDKIGLDKALDIALQDANLSLNKVEIIKEEYNEDDNTSKYEISFTNNNIEYDYEIDATSGKIIKVDKEKI
jgi:uncharacterized membrane protein YkoI